MMREGIKLEERTVFLSLEQALKDLVDLPLAAGKKTAIRERLMHLRRDTIEHTERFKAANVELHGVGNAVR
jgi:hypothetical protein